MGSTETNAKMENEKRKAAVQSVSLVTTLMLKAGAPLRREDKQSRAYMIKVGKCDTTVTITLSSDPASEGIGPQFFSGNDGPEK